MIRVIAAKYVINAINIRFDAYIICLASWQINVAKKLMKSKRNSVNFTFHSLFNLKYYVLRFYGYRWMRASPQVIFIYFEFSNLRWISLRLFTTSSFCQIFQLNASALTFYFPPISIVFMTFSFHFSKMSNCWNQYFQL